MIVKKIRLLIVVTFSAFFISLSFLLLLPPDARTTYEQYSQKLARELTEKSSLLPDEGPASPDLAAFQDYLQTMDPATGRVPGERLREARQRMDQYSKLSPKDSRQITWTEHPSNMGGRVRAFMFDPTDITHKKVWCGGITGGIWYNYDITQADSSWHAVNNYMDNLSISCLAYDPNNTNTFYAGTGEGQTAVVIYRESSGRGSGILRSDNAGQTWALIPSTADFAYVNDIVIRNENGNSVIYAAVVSGIYKGVAFQSLPKDGLYRSADNGLSWTQVLPFIAGTQNPYSPADIAIAANGRIFVGTQPNTSLEGGACILYSDSGTAGTWSLYNNYNIIIKANTSGNNLPGRVIVATAPSNANTVYAIIGAGYNSGFNYYEGDYLIRSTNGGSTWNLRNHPPNYSNGRNWAYLSWHAFALAVDPYNASNLYAGGLDLHKSTDGGNSWNRVSDWALMYSGGGNDYVHADQHSISWRPGSPGNIAFTCDGGVFFTSTGNNNQPVFHERNKSLSTLQFYSCALDPLMGSNNFLGGLQDNGTLFYYGSPVSINNMISGGDGALCFIDKDENNIMLTSSQYANVNVFESGNWTNNFSATSAVFINPADYDYDLNIYYMNQVTFFGSNLNLIGRVSGIPYFIQQLDVPLSTNAGSYFTHIKYSPNSPSGTSTLFLGTQSGELFKVVNAHAVPIATNIGSSSFPTAAISCVAVSSSDDTLLVTFSNYGVSSVWQTYNGGASWEEKEGNLPDMPVRWAIYHPQDPQQAMIATELGTWVCANLSSSNPFWYPEINGMANVRVDMLQLRENDLTVLAATHGRGMFTSTFTLNPTVGIAGNDVRQITVYPNPAEDYVYIKLYGIGHGAGTAELLDNAGRVVSSHPINHSSHGLQIETAHLQGGMYIVRVVFPGREEYFSKLIVK